MEPGHLLHSVLTCPPSGKARHLKSKYPFVPTTQQLTSSPNNRNGALLADHRWNADWLQNTTRLHTFSPDIGTHPPEMALPRIALVRLNHLRTGIECFCSWLHNGAWPFCGLWVWRGEIARWPCCLPVSNTQPSTSPGLHDLTALDDETIECLLNTSHEI